MAKTCAGVDTNILECSGGGDAGIWAIIAMAINILSILVGIAGVIGITFFGIQVLTAKGDSTKIEKAKKRLFQIVLGLSAYILLWAGSQWLLPGGLFRTPNDIDSISIELNTGVIYVGDSFAPTIKFNPESPLDPSYTLTSQDTKIIVINDNALRCIKQGQANITATSVNGKQDTKTVSCINKPKPTREDEEEEDEDEDEEDEDEDNNGSNSGEMPDGDYYTPNQIDAFNQEWASLNNVTYDEVKSLAQNMGISDQNLAGILAWAHFESYELSDRYGPYFAYLCNSVGVNSALSYESRGNGSGWLNQIVSWGGGYTQAEYTGTHEYSGSYGSGYLPSNLKSVYMALKHTYPNIYGCSGQAAWGGGYDPSIHSPVYDPVGANGTGGDSLIFDGYAP